MILLNGFFVAAEFSLVKIRSSQIDLLTQQGNKKAKLIQHIHDHLDRYLSACQLGITIASLALGWVGEPFIAEQLIHRAERLQIDISPETAHKIAVPLAFALITAGHIVVGELAPKSWAIRDSLRVSFLAAYPLRLFTKIFSPIIRFLTWLSNILLYLCGIAPASEDETHSEAELRMIVTESEEDGQINAGERDLIHNVFEFDNRQVSEIMAPIDKVFSIDIDAWDDKLIHGLIIEGYSRIPVYQGDINNII